MTTLVTWFAILSWIGIVGAHLLAVIFASLQPWIARRFATHAQTPPVTIVMPLCGLEPELSSNLDKLFAQDYPDFDVSFAIVREDDPAMPIARAAQARWPHIKSEIRIGEATQYLDSKVRNEFKCLEAAERPFIYVVDANVSLPVDALRRAMRAMQGNVGSVASCPMAVRPENAIGELEVAFINGFAARYLLAGAALGFNTILGKSLLFRWSGELRQEITRQFGKIDAEDAAILYALIKYRLRARFSDAMVEHPVGRRTLRDLWGRHTRWAMYRRKYHSFTYFLEMISSFFPGLFFGALAGSILGLGSLAGAILTAVLWFGAEAVLHWCKRWPVRWRTPFFWLGRELLLPAVWVKGLTAREVVWKGRRIPVR